MRFVMERRCGRTIQNVVGHTTFRLFRLSLLPPHVFKNYLLTWFDQNFFFGPALIP